MQWSLQLSSDLAFVFDALCASDSAVQLLVPVRVYVQYEYVYEEYGKEEGDKEKEKTRKMESGWDQRSKTGPKRLETDTQVCRLGVSWFDSYAGAVTGG